MRDLARTLVISVALSVGLLQMAPTGVSSAFSQGMRHLVLIPFGILCPLCAGGCLLHERLAATRPRRAALLRAAGIALLAAAAAVLFWLRLCRSA